MSEQNMNEQKTYYQVRGNVIILNKELSMLVRNTTDGNVYIVLPNPSAAAEGKGVELGAALKEIGDFLAPLGIPVNNMSETIEDFLKPVVDINKVELFLKQAYLLKCGGDGGGEAKKISEFAFEIMVKYNSDPTENEKLQEGQLFKLEDITFSIWSFDENDGEGAKKRKEAIQKHMSVVEVNGIGDISGLLESKQEGLDG